MANVPEHRPCRGFPDARRILTALLAALLALATLAAPAGATAAQPQATLLDIEDEVMCPICGTLLELSAAPQAERQRVFISRLISQGRTKEEIKDALVAEYGQEVLALPDDSGFDLSAYVVPIVGFALAAGGIALAVLRWRRAGRGGTPVTSPPAGAERDRLDADMAKYDL